MPHRELPRPPRLFLPDPTALDGVLVGRQGRTEFVQTVLRHNLPPQAITAVATRHATVHVVLLAVDRRANTVLLAGEDSGNVVRELQRLGSGYQMRTPTSTVLGVLAGMARDYSPGTPTRQVVDALTEVVTLLVERRAHGDPGVPLQELDQAIGQHLAPLFAAWAQS
jgi:hypothetical protein